SRLDPDLGVVGGGFWGRRGLRPRDAPALRAIPPDLLDLGTRNGRIAVDRRTLPHVHLRKVGGEAPDGLFILLLLFMAFPFLLLVLQIARFFFASWRIHDLEAVPCLAL